MEVTTVGEAEVDDEIGEAGAIMEMGGLESGVPVMVSWPRWLTAEMRVVAGGGVVVGGAKGFLHQRLNN